MTWAATARGQGGIITRRQLYLCGLSADAVDRMLSRHELEHVCRGIFRVRGGPASYLSALWAAVLATDGVLGFATGAHLWGVEESAPDEIDVIVNPTRRIAKPHGVRVHRVFVPPSRVQLRDGLPITVRSQTVLDHIGRLSMSKAIQVTDRALQRGWLTRQDLAQHLRNFPGRQGNRMLRIIAEATADNAAAKSERHLQKLLRQAGIRGWKANHRVFVDGRLIAVVDIAFPRVRLAVEVDGWAFHSDVERFQRDRHRQNALVAAGWTVLRFTWSDLIERPEYVLASIVERMPRNTG